MTSFFADNGYERFQDEIPAILLDELQSTLANLIRHALQRGATGRSQLEELITLSNSELLHQGMLYLYLNDEKQFQYVVDAACNSTSLHRLVNAQSVLTKVSALLGSVDNNLINISQARLRVDLPAQYKKNKKKMHLDYHQESGYFTVNVSRSTGLVGWIPLFDCGEKEGALRILPHSHKLGQIAHDYWYEDPQNKRQKRAKVPTDITDRYHDIPLESKRGDITFQHFDLIHRSGDNDTDDRIRYTVVVRYSNLLAEDFFPVSWNQIAP